MEAFYSAAPPETKSEDLPFDISWLTDWFFFYLREPVDGAVHASVPSIFDFIFVVFSIVILILLFFFGASLWFKHIK